MGEMPRGGFRAFCALGIRSLEPVSFGNSDKISDRECGERFWLLTIFMPLSRLGSY